MYYATTYILRRDELHLYIYSKDELSESYISIFFFEWTILDTWKGICI